MTAETSLLAPVSCHGSGVAASGGVGSARATSCLSVWFPLPGTTRSLGVSPHSSPGEGLSRHQCVRALQKRSSPFPSESLSQKSSLVHPRVNLSSAPSPRGRLGLAWARGGCHSPSQSNVLRGEVGSHTARSSGRGRRGSFCLHRRGSGELPSAGGGGVGGEEFSALKSRLGWGHLWAPLQPLSRRTSPKP